jgi:hypothetical protein
MCPEIWSLSYKNQHLSKIEIRKVPSGDEYMHENRKLEYGYIFNYKGEFRYEALTVRVKKGEDTLSPSTRKSFYFRDDSLYSEFYESTYYPDQKKYYASYKTVVSYLNNGGYQIQQTFKGEKGAWIDFYRSNYDSIKTTKRIYNFESYEATSGSYKVSAYEYFDSIVLSTKKSTLQFLFRDDDADGSDGPSWDKYTFNLNGSFISYENWTKYSDMPKPSRNSKCTYTSDANGRPLKGSTFIEMETEGDVKEYQSFTYEKLSDQTDVAIGINKLGSFWMIDWCQDVGREVEMVLINQDLKVEYYNTFPIGNPYLNVSKIKPGKYYLILFDRTESIGNLKEVEIK